MFMSHASSATTPTHHQVDATTPFSPIPQSPQQQDLLVNNNMTLDPSSVTSEYYYDISDVIKNTELAMNESSLTNPPNDISNHSSRFRIQYLKLMRKFKSLSLWSKLFLLLVIILVTTIFIAGLTSMIFNAAVLKNSTAIYFLSAMFLLSGLSLVYFACVAIFAENEYLLFAFLVQSIWGGLMAAFMVYQSAVAISIAENNHNSGTGSGTGSGNNTGGNNTGGNNNSESNYVTTKVVVILLIIIPTCLYYIAFLLFVIILIPVYRSFGWKIFRRVGSSPHLVRYYRFYCIYKAILQVDVGFLTALLTMAMFWLKFDWMYLSQIGLVASYIFSLICVPLTLLAIKKEWYLLQIPVLLFDLVLPGYLVYKIIEAWIEKETRIAKDSVLDQTAIVVIMTIISIFVLLVRFVMITFGVICTVNFRKGLKKIFEQDFISYKKRFYTWFGMKNRLNRLNAELQQSLMEAQQKEEVSKSSSQQQQYRLNHHDVHGETKSIHDDTPMHEHVEKKKKKKKKKKKVMNPETTAYSQL
ncbi:hypothetical protein C9374_002299 [Naegleria lovaniensis]|uniref:Uncharacterized protein n=1 Tax=Naegleria lovaniensis TaxID=51637 RepID=A0AA88GPI0_NAELO|nr:uncharacterized protein C9374_002299 [Naegleria lovaniensis]KAG2386555.1 hypothetical protein C9374_002299 [Naegleria lovaniensis]